eukprot:3517463-Prymnesium_polylepis.1
MAVCACTCACTSFMHASPVDVRIVGVLEGERLTKLCHVELPRARPVGVRPRVAVSQRVSRAQPSELASRPRGGEGPGERAALAGGQEEAHGTA